MAQALLPEIRPPCGDVFSFSKCSSDLLVLALSSFVLVGLLLPPPSSASCGLRAFSSPFPSHVFVCTAKGHLPRTRSLRASPRTEATLSLIPCSSPAFCFPDGHGSAEETFTRLRCAFALAGHSLALILPLPSFIILHHPSSCFQTSILPSSTHDHRSGHLYLSFLSFHKHLRAIAFPLRGPTPSRPGAS